MTSLIVYSLKATKAIINKWDNIKLKTLHRKETNKMKRQPTNWEKNIYKSCI